MATKRKKSEGAAKPTGRGGPRPNSGRKPKATTKLRDALIAELAGTGEVPAVAKADAAGYAFRLLVGIMQDDRAGITTRLDCAAEVLNRVWGRPKQAVELAGQGGGPIVLTTEARAQAARELAEWQAEIRARLENMPTGPPAPRGD